MEFNTQICTTREQSERLLAMGLKPETADMVWRNEVIRGKEYSTLSVLYGLPPLSQDTPAWSLHRLMAICHFENSYFTNLDTAYDAIIRDIEGKIRFNMLDSRYLIEKSNER